MRVLLVEDNESSRVLLRRWLERAGHAVALAEDGVAAVAAARAGRPDLIIMDVGLPVMDGLAATRELRRSPETAGVRIVALTAHAFAEDREQALDAGCDAFQAKPVDLTALRATIERLCGREHVA
jgi:two-component system cell cycle response regulator DivK